MVEGKTFIDPVWAKIVSYGADEVPEMQRKTTRELIEGCVKAKPNGAALMAEFNRLGDVWRAEAAE